MLGYNASETVYISANVFVEVATQEDLMFCFEFFCQEGVKGFAELLVRILVGDAFTLHLKYLLLMDGGDACGSGVLWGLVSRNDGDAFAEAAKKSDSAELAHWIRVLFYYASRGGPSNGEEGAAWFTKTVEGNFAAGGSKPGVVPYLVSVTGEGALDKGLADVEIDFTGVNDAGLDMLHLTVVVENIKSVMG
jgi:hypothetical protein